MTRQDFIFRLFDNGEGLTLDQIRQVEDNLLEKFPDGLIEDIAKDMGVDRDYPGVIERAMDISRDIFFCNIHDVSDMLELRDFFLEQAGITLTDMQTYRLWYAIGTGD